MRRLIWLVIICCLVVAGCTNTRANKGNTNNISKKELSGKATWYGKKFHGKKTASGEKFDMFAMTAAHKKIEFGKKVKVTNLKTGKSVEVYINDRGPFIEGVIIDLSYLAFKEIGNPNDGFININLEIIE